MHGRPFGTSYTTIVTLSAKVEGTILHRYSKHCLLEKQKQTRSQSAWPGLALYELAKACIILLSKAKLTVKIDLGARQIWSNKDYRFV